jgi:hypothetical protein
MELRPEEDNSQEQRHSADTNSFATHVLNKTKLMPEWLQGQAELDPSGSLLAIRRKTLAVCLLRQLNLSLSFERDRFSLPPILGDRHQHPTTLLREEASPAGDKKRTCQLL